jgi:hypothetical protein
MSAAVAAEAVTTAINAEAASTLKAEKRMKAPPDESR